MKKVLSLILAFSILSSLVSTTVSAQETGITETLLLQDAYADAQPCFSMFNTGKELLCFLQNNPNQAEANNSTLFYAVKQKNNGWQAPRMVSDNGTYDNEPFCLIEGDNAYITWVDANRFFTEEDTKQQKASSLRVSFRVFDNNTNSFITDKLDVTEIYSANTNVCCYKPTVTSLNGKIVISWLICRDLSTDYDNNNTYGVEAVYYDVTTNTFSTDTNQTDKAGKLIPMSLAKNANFISSYSIGYRDGELVALFSEDIDGKIDNNERNYSLQHDGQQVRDPKQIVKSGMHSDREIFTDTSSYTSVLNSGTNDLYYYYKNKIYKMAGSIGAPVVFADVTKTGDTDYRMIMKNGVPAIITALAYEPFNVSGNDTQYFDQKYTEEKSQWINEKGESVILQEKICLYFYDANKNQVTGVSNLLQKDSVYFTTNTAGILGDDGELRMIQCAVEKADSIDMAKLSYIQCPEAYLRKADYRMVEKAESLVPNKLDVYTDITANALKTAINDIQWDLDYTHQTTIDSYAQALYDAIQALEYKKANYVQLDEAIAAIPLDLTIYTDESVIALNDAVKAVDWDKNITEQEIVDSYATAIRKAIKALEYRNADYVEVDEAIAAIPSDLTVYTDESVRGLKDAVKAVIRNKNITEQEIVNQYASNINNARRKLMYKIVDGNYQIVEKHSDKEARFCSAADFKKFLKVCVNGVEVDAKHYTVEGGGTTVSLKPMFLDTLPLGNHTIQIISTDGTAEAVFTVQSGPSPESESPQTGEREQGVNGIILLVLAGTAVLFVIKRKEPSKS